ncbi:MAG: hypothetical protein AB7K24_34085, partial [Gemmataceae bacterium]
QETPAADAPKEGDQGAQVATVLERRWRKLDVYRDQEVEKYATRKVRTRGRRIYTIIALMLGLAGIFAGMITWVQPVVPPYFVPLFITEYESPLLPVNAEGDPDRQALTANDYFPRIDQNSFSSQERHLFLQDLAGLRQRDPDDSVLVYLSAFSCAGPDGRLYLFPADVIPDNRQTWIPMETILEYIRDCPCRRKLLVLDTLKPIASVRLGVLEDDASSLVPGEIQRMQAKMREDGLDPARLGLILTSCAPGQVSFASEAMGRSAFNYYFEEALRGYAEGYDLDRNEDGRVFVSEIHEFLKRRVDRWASIVRDSRQTPTLLGSGPDFPIVALEHGVALPYVEMPAQPAYPDWLLAAWKVRDQWETEHLNGLDPRIMNELVAKLLRAEQQWRGGVDAERVKNDLTESMGRFTALRDQARNLLPYPQPRSLALAQFLGAKPDPAITQDLQDIWTKLVQQMPTLKPPEAQMARDKAIQGFVTKYKKATAFQVAWAVFDVANVEANPTAPLLRFLDDIRGQFSTQPAYIETEFLHRLVVLAAKTGDEQFPQATVRLALDVVQKGENAVVDARVFPWTSGVLAEAMQMRYDAEVVLFSPGYAPDALADARFARANDLYDLAGAHEATVRQAQEARDPAFDFLFRYIEILVTDPSLQSNWDDALTALGQVDALLANPPAKALTSTEALRQQGELFRQRTTALQQHVDRLRWAFEADHLAALIRQCNDPQATPAVARLAETALNTPFLRADDRKALWEARLGLTRRLAQQVLDRDAEDDSSRQLTPMLVDFDRQQERYEELQRQRALLRGKALTALFPFADLPKEAIDELRSKLATAGSSDAARAQASIHQAAQLIRHAWSDLVPAALHQQKSLYVQDRISRIVPPFESVPLIDNPQTNPTVQLRVGEV